MSPKSADADNQPNPAQQVADSSCGRAAARQPWRTQCAIARTCWCCSGSRSSWWAASSSSSSPTTTTTADPAAPVAGHRRRRHRGHPRRDASPTTLIEPGKRQGDRGRPPTRSVPGAIQSLNQLEGATFVQGFAAEPADHQRRAAARCSRSFERARGLRGRRRAARLRRRRRRLREPRRPHQPLRRLSARSTRSTRTRPPRRAAPHQRRGARRRTSRSRPDGHVVDRDASVPRPAARTSPTSSPCGRPTPRRSSLAPSSRRSTPRSIADDAAAAGPTPGQRRRQRSSRTSPTSAAAAEGLDDAAPPRSSSSTGARSSPTSSGPRWPSSRPSPRSSPCSRLGAVGEVLEAEGPFDVLVAGPSLGTRSGLARLRLIREDLPAMSLVLAFSRRPDASLRDIVRTGAIDLLQLPVEDKELAEAVERGIELAAAAAPRGHRGRRRAGGRRRPAAPAGPGTVFTIASATGGCGKTFYATNLAYFLTRYTREAGLHRRPRPPVRRGVHRPAAAPEVHDLRRPPARGHRRGRPPGPHRGVHGRRTRPACTCSPRPGSPSEADRITPAGRHPDPRGRPQAVRLRHRRHPAGAGRDGPRRLRPVRHALRDGHARPAERAQHERVPRARSSG